MRSFVAFRYGFRTLFHPVKERLFTDLNQPAASERRKTGGVNQLIGAHSGNSHNAPDVRHAHHRVGRRLEVDHFRPLAQIGFDFGEAAHIGQQEPDAEMAENLLQQSVGADASLLLPVISLLDGHLLAKVLHGTKLPCAIIIATSP